MLTCAGGDVCICNSTRNNNGNCQNGKKNLLTFPKIFIIVSVAAAISTILISTVLLVSLVESIDSTVSLLS
jgi:hypothetical protein